MGSCTRGRRALGVAPPPGKGIGHRGDLSAQTPWHRPESAAKCPGTARRPEFGRPVEWRDTGRAMSEENVEIVRLHIDAWRAEEATRALSFLDPHIVMDLSRTGGAGVGEGP